MTDLSKDKLDNFVDFVLANAWATEKYWYPALGLAGETGEAIEVVKKMIRDNKGVVTPEIKHDLILELGDVLHYLIRLAKDFDISMDEIIDGNTEKLSKRRIRNAG